MKQSLLVSFNIQTLPNKLNNKSQKRNQGSKEEPRQWHIKKIKIKKIKEKKTLILDQPTLASVIFNTQKDLKEGSKIGRSKPWSLKLLFLGMKANKNVEQKKNKNNNKDSIFQTPLRKMDKTHQDKTSKWKTTSR